MWTWQCAEPRNRKGIVDQRRITKHSTWRYFGLLANHHRQAQLAICRRLLGIAPAAPAAAPPAELDGRARGERIAGLAPPACPACRLGRMLAVETILRKAPCRLARMPRDRRRRAANAS